MSTVNRPDCLTPDQIKWIKKFDEKVLLRVRADLKYEPDKENNFKWIYSKCMSYKYNSSNKQYSRHQYISTEDQELFEELQLQYERSKYPVREFKPKEKYVQKTTIKNPELINSKFVELIGMEAFVEYTKRCNLL